MPDPEPTPAPGAPPSRKFNRPTGRAGFMIFVSALIGGLMIVAAWRAQAGLNWLLVALLLALFICMLGWYITGRIDGIFINERNLVSLSRFQLGIWTVIILSGFLVIAFSRIKAHNGDPLAIGMDWHLWALMGISTASLIGSPLILNSKKEKEPDDKAMNKAEASLREPREDIDKNREGVLYTNETVDDASFADMFQGDEVQNSGHLDLAKVQMFLFTTIAALAYSVTLWNMFEAAKGTPGSLETMPGLSDGLIALLGISHSGFLASKGVDHTTTTN